MFSLEKKPETVHLYSEMLELLLAIGSTHAILYDNPDLKHFVDTHHSEGIKGELDERAAHYKMFVFSNKSIIPGNINTNFRSI